ncbi:MAG: Uma2 family endonuclease [Cyanobacteria bacterium J06642_11]
MALSVDEWCCWPSGSKLELLNGQFIVSDHIKHSRLLLSHILRGWGSSAAIPFAPLSLWWEALTEVFRLPSSIANKPLLHQGEARDWAEKVSFNPGLLQHHGHWCWAYSQLRQDLRMALYRLEHEQGSLGESLGGGFVNRLNEDGLMPDLCFYRGEPRNRLFEYFIDGPPEIVVELLQPGSEQYGREVKRNRYEAAGVPELWLLDVASECIELLRWAPGGYQQQLPEASGRYEVSSIPGLTFFPDRLWRDEGESRRRSLEKPLFQVGARTPLRKGRIPYAGKGIDETRGLVKLQAQLTPDAISFDDYIYWCPEAKFELVDGRPWLGGREGIQGLLGLLLKTFGLLEVVKLAHPKDWVQALLQVQSEDTNQEKRQAWWRAARQQAQFLRDQFGVTKVAVAGALEQDAPLDYWSKLILVLWDVPDVQKPYASIQDTIGQMNSDPEIRLIFADRELSDTESQVMASGWIEV